VTFSTWGDLIRDFCSIKRSTSFYEDFATRRYNYAASNDHRSCRLIFLRDVLKDKQNKTLRRQGRFIWCRQLKYEGKNGDGFRSISFTVDKGHKRFYVGENNMLCLPSNICVQNNRFFKSKKKTFLPFSTVFSYKNSLNMMIKNGEHDEKQLLSVLEGDNPYRPGTLVAPRHGYFFPDIDPKKLDKEISSDQSHPCGIILGPSLLENKYVDREFYRVRFGNTTYERVHPVQMEIVNEI
jgi:hypothetical protein